MSPPVADAVIDTCIHHRWTSDPELREYLDENWRHYVGTPGSLVGGKGMRRVQTRTEILEAVPGVPGKLAREIHRQLHRAG